jgi:hypothetical protein
MSKGQVSIYIIIVIVIVALVVFVVVVSNRSNVDDIPQELRPVFDYYESCIETNARTAIQLAGEGGGRVFVTGYVPGSEYAPFASHLNFLGSPVEYWYSVQGNGVIKENVPTEQEMEGEIAQYVEQNMGDCDFSGFYEQGFYIEAGEAKVSVDVLERKVEVTADSVLTVSRGDVTARKDSNYIELDSKLGKFYNLAREIYDDEKSSAFMENYAVDVLYNYAPVDGVEIQCGPKIWKADEVVSDLREGLQNNFQTIKLDGNYYSISDKSREYFVHQKSVDEAVNFIYSKDWPSRIEIYGDGVDNSLMIGEPVGTQAGMGAMGFCYVPYHFIYDMQFPVMVQLYDTSELFQFPFVVIVDKSMPRNGLQGEAYIDESDFNLCEYMTQDVTINLFDTNLNRVNGNVSFECFDQKCSLGESESGVLRTAAPACVNGYVFVRAGGFAEKKQLFSSNEQSSVDVILEKEYSLEVELKLGGSKIDDEMAIVSFTKDDGTVATAALPESNEVKLSEGNYEIKVYVYGNSSITIPASTKSQCVDAPRGGLLGLLGSTKEQCFDISLPATKIESALVGGGEVSSYLLESELRKGKIIISADRLPAATSLEQLSNNFEIFDTKRLGVEFDTS